jgi:RHS repeat-associated protein
MNGRSFSNENYRFGFNGKERDNETFNDAYDFGARILDTRLGRWLSVDPLQAKFVSLSPYNFVANSPLIFIDPDGKDIITGQGASGTFSRKIECSGDIAMTSTTISMTYNKETKGYVVKVTSSIHTNTRLGSDLQQYNDQNWDGLLLYVSMHEGIHVRRNLQAATMDIMVSEGSNTYTGKIDVVLNSFYNDVYVKEIENAAKEYSSKLEALDVKYKKDQKEMLENKETKLGALADKLNEDKKSLKIDYDNKLNKSNKKLEGFEVSVEAEFKKNRDKLNIHNASFDAELANNINSLPTSNNEERSLKKQVKNASVDIRKGFGSRLPSCDHKQN